MSRRCSIYVVDLGGGEVYVGATSGTPEERYARHKAGGKTSVRVVRERGRGLRPDLVVGDTEETVSRRLRRAGYRVRGDPRPFTYRR